MNIRGTFQTAVLALPKMNWASAALLAITVVLGVLYIWQVNMSATRGFALRDLEQDIEELQLQNDRYHMEVAHLQSIDSVTTRMKMLGLTPVQNVEYVTPGSGSVAINR